MTLFDGDTFEHRGYTFRFETKHDESMGEPWKEHDGHGIVSEWTRRDKRPSERVLASDRRAFRYYDFGKTLAIARRDGWGTADGKRPGESAKAYAARAVEADYEYLRRWYADEWCWVGVIVTICDDAGTDDGGPDASLWGIESDGDAYLTTVAYELADEILATVEVETPLAQLSEN